MIDSCRPAKSLYAWISSSDSGLSSLSFSRITSGRSAGRTRRLAKAKASCTRTA